MATLWKRATPPQYRMLRAIAGAVHNAAHAHQQEISHNFARSVAKRAVGTLTAQWPDVLAAKHQRRQEAAHGQVLIPGRRGSQATKESSKGGRLGLLRRSPIRQAWKEISLRMWGIKNGGTPEQYQAHIRALQLLDEAQRVLDAATPKRSEGE